MTGKTMTTILWVLAAVCLLVLLCLAPTIANAQQPQAQPPCGDHDKIVAQLSAKYKEAPRAMGITGGNSFLEIYVSPSGTWTTMITTPNGPTCIVGTGEGWEDITPKPAGTSL